MIKKLTPIGNSLGLVIEKPVLDLLKITRDTTLEVTTDGESLLVRPVKNDKRSRVRESTSRMMSAHDATMRKLAK